MLMLQHIARHVRRLTCCSGFLQEIVECYLAPLIERLLGLFNTAPLKVKAVATGAIGFDAHASRDNFLP